MDLRLSRFLPAALLGGGTAAILLAAQLFPTGEALLLVRLADDAPLTALAAASRADARLVASRSGGLALLYGDAARIRATVGLAISYKGLPACAPPP